MNWAAFRWSVLCGTATAAAPPLLALSKQEPDWQSVVVAMAPIFLGGFAAGYAVFRDLLPKGPGVVAPKEYGWRTPSVVAVATSVLIAAMVAGGLVGAVLLESLITVMSQNPVRGAVADPGLEGVLSLLMLLAEADRDEAISRLGEQGVAYIPAAMAGIFFFLACPFVGRWIGYKSVAGKGIIAIVWTIVVHRVVMTLLDISVLGYEQYLQMLSDFGTSFQSTLLAIPIALAFCLAGYWFGRRVRGSNYLHYILLALPADSREQLLYLAHDEADRLRSLSVEED